MSFNLLFEAYKNSEDYKKLSTQVTVEGAEEEEKKKDTDPKGFFKYSELVSAFTCLTFVKVEWQTRLQFLCWVSC